MLIVTVIKHQIILRLTISQPYLNYDYGVAEKI
jgi:hypothetical protein